MRALMFPIGLLVASTAHAQDAILPVPVREMMEAAIANGNETEIATVAKIAKQTNPGSADQIQKMVNSWKQRTQATRDTVIREASFTELWTGRVEAGGFLSTGSADEVGVTATGSIKRTGLQWSHKLSGLVDYRRANGVLSRERYLASYEPRYEFSPRGFAYGIAQFERDRTIGYAQRYTGSAGIGYKLVVSDPVDLAVDVGPSIRHVRYFGGMDETKLGARASMDMTWRMAPTLKFRQMASSYAESRVYSLNSLTSLENRLGSHLAVALSYNILYESETLLSVSQFDTLSRVTLTYDF